MDSAESPHSTAHRRLSSSFTDSAIDVELSDSTQSGDDSVRLPVPSAKGHADPSSSLNERISHIARLAAAAEKNSSRQFSVDENAALNKCLDDLETLLHGDPRPEISRVIALNRPSSPPSRSPTPTPTSTSTANANLTPVAAPRRKDDGPFFPRQITEQKKQQQQTSADDLKSVLRELSSVNADLQQRYIESRHIHDLFIVKCEGLAQRIIELENEVHELKSDILEDTIELEGLRGTIRGLESWVSRWQRQRDAAAAAASSSSANTARRPKKKSSWRWKKNNSTTDNDNEDDEENDSDFDTFLDGVLAWMRGWNDVEEGFLVRARRRKMRRDLKSVSPG